MAIENRSDALRVLYAGFDAFDTARQQVRDDLSADAGLLELYRDGRVSENDLRAVADGEGFTEDQRDAARFLLEDGGLRDGLDGADDGGDIDGIIGRDGIHAFLSAHRDGLEYDAVAILDARDVLAEGDHDDRLQALAERTEGLPPGDRQALLREVLRQDDGAPGAWLQPERLAGLFNAGRIDSDTYEALADELPTLPGHLPDPPEGSVRVTTYNIGQGASRGEGKGTDFDEIPQLAANMAASRSDVFLVQEVFEDDVEPLVEALQAQEDRLADAEGRDARTVHATFSNADGSKEVRHEDGRHTLRGGGFGNAVISYTEQTVVYGDGQPKLSDDGDEGRRIMGVQLELDGETVTVFNTHLSSTGAPDSGRREDDRQATQLAEAFDVVERYGGDGPVIFGGDFNTATHYGRPSADVLNAGIESLGLEDTGRSAGPTSDYGFGNRIDALLTSGFETVGAYRMAAGTSDHAGVVADIALS